MAAIFSACAGSTIWWPISSTPLLDSIQERLIILCLPGVIASMAISGNAHAFSSTVVFVASTAFYTFCFYFPIRWVVRRRKARRGAQ
jgi:hypothetical protein